MLTRSLVFFALVCVAIVFAQEGEFVLRRAPNPETTKQDEYFAAAVLEGEALTRRTPEPTKKDDNNNYYWNGAVAKQNEDKPVAIAATTLAPVVAQVAPLTQQQLVEKLRQAREKINDDAVVKKQQIAVAQQKFADAKDSCKRMVGKYKGIAKKIRTNIKKAQKNGNTLAVSRGKKAISNLKGRFKKDVMKCKAKVQSAKTLMVTPYINDNQGPQQDQLQKLRQVAQKQIKIEQNKFKRARRAHTKKFAKDFKKATDAAKKGNKTKLVKFVKKARADAKKEIHQVLKYTQEAAKNADVFTAKKMFINVKKHVAGIKKKFVNMKKNAKKAIHAGKHKKSAKKGNKTVKRVIVKNNLKAKKAERTIVLALKTGDAELLKKGRRLARQARKVVKRTKHSKTTRRGKMSPTKAKKAERTIVLALRTGDAKLLKKGKRLARQAFKGAKGARRSKKSFNKAKKAKKHANTLAIKAKKAQNKVKKMVKSGRTKCRSKVAFRKFKTSLKHARKSANTLALKAKKAKKIVKKLTKKHAKSHKKSQKARKCPK